MAVSIKRGLWIGLLSLWAVGSWAQPGSQPQSPPPQPAEAETEVQPAQAATPVIERLNQALLTAMRQGKTLGYEGRYRLLEPVLGEVYDFRAISRYVLSSYWKQLDEAQKRELVDRMRRYGIAAYAAQFDDYGGERFEITGEKPFRNRFRIVQVVMRAPKGDDTHFTYILHRTRSGWKIIDVRYDGVSDLALKRSQFAKILKDEGFEALLAKLDEKIAAYAREKKKEAKS